MLRYINRINTDSTKWDTVASKFGNADLLPFWIADMDFAIPYEAKCKVVSYVKNGVFGYYTPEEGYYENFINFEKEIHGIEIKKDWICFAPGVVCAINWLIQAFTKENDAVITLVPVYYPFMDAVKDNNRKLVKCNLNYNEGNITINFKEFEKEIVVNSVKMFLFCSPHNPLGRVWTKKEVQQLFDICKKHGVLIVSDEIHHNLIMPGNRFTSALSLNRYNSCEITLMAASKTFNIAGLKNSYVIIKDRKLRSVYEEYYKRLRIHGGNSISYIAVAACYKYGKKWLAELISQVWGNYSYLSDNLIKNYPELIIPELQGTYLMWIDFSSYLKGKTSIEDFMEKECFSAVDYGQWFGSRNYKYCVRINLATCKKNVRKLYLNIESALAKYRQD